MSELVPRGVPVMLDGVERHVLFTLNVIDALQDKFGKNIFSILQDATKDDGPESNRTFISVVTLILNDEAVRAARAKARGSIEYTDDYPILTEDDVGDMIDIDNYATVLRAIFEAYHISMPEADDDESPSRDE